jgi:hypothetical protein
MPLRLDHLSYATSQDQLVDVVQRLGSRIGSAFIDGGIHPRFGTRNFTLALKNDHYLEVVCPLDHPVAYISPFGRLVSQRANEGGGWLTWVVSTEDLSPIESRLGRSAIDGFRRCPDGSELKWKQLGVLGTLSDSQLPFFIQWISSNRPSNEGKATAEIMKIEISGDEKTIEEWLDSDLSKTFDGVEIQWVTPESNDGQTGLVAVHLSTSNGLVRLD